MICKNKGRFYSDLKGPADSNPLRIALGKNKQQAARLERQLAAAVAEAGDGALTIGTQERLVDGLGALPQGERSIATLVRRGVLPPEVLDYERPEVVPVASDLGDAIDEYVAHKQAQGRTEATARRSGVDLRRVLIGKPDDPIPNLGRGWCRVSQITHAGVMEAIRHMAAHTVKGELLSGNAPKRVRAARHNTSQQHYLVPCKAFARWLTKTGRAPWGAEDPLREQRVTNVPNANRRALTLEEQFRLIWGTVGQDPVGTQSPVSGETRSVLYHVTLSCALRRGEVVALTLGDFVGLKTDSPRLDLHGLDTKSKRPRDMPIPTDLAERVAARFDALGATTADAKLFPEVRRYFIKTLPDCILPSDLWAAGIQRETAEGRVDFHALRVTAITTWALNGVPLTLAAKWAGHSSVELTQKVYSRAGVDEEKRYVAQLPSLSRGTGTDDSWGTDR